MARHLQNKPTISQFCVVTTRSYSLTLCPLLGKVDPSPAAIVSMSTPMMKGVEGMLDCEGRDEDDVEDEREVAA